jgi:hypothetical protein
MTGRDEGILAQINLEPAAAPLLLDTRDKRRRHQAGQ